MKSYICLSTLWLVQVACSPLSTTTDSLDVPVASTAARQVTIATTFVDDWLVVAEEFAQIDASVVDETMSPPSREIERVIDVLDHEPLVEVTASPIQLDASPDFRTSRGRHNEDHSRQHDQHHEGDFRGPHPPHHHHDGLQPHPRLGFGLIHWVADKLGLSPTPPRGYHHQRPHHKHNHGRDIDLRKSCHHFHGGPAGDRAREDDRFASARINDDMSLHKPCRHPHRRPEDDRSRHSHHYEGDGEDAPGLDYSESEADRLPHTRHRHHHLHHHHHAHHAYFSLFSPLAHFKLLVVALVAAILVVWRKKRSVSRAGTVRLEDDSDDVRETLFEEKTKTRETTWLPVPVHTVTVEKV